MPNFIKASYNEKARTVEYIADNGDRLLRTGGTIAWRFNNPGNLRPGSKYKRHIGEGHTLSGNFLIFPTPEAGREEKKGLLLRKYKDHSIRNMLYLYAPPAENDTENYVKNVCSKTGFSRDQIVGWLLEHDLEKLMTAMEEHEGYHHKKETRKEIWVRTTSVGFSDGARPLAELPVKIKRNGEETITKTNGYGQLAQIVHFQPGEAVELWVEDIKKEWQKLETITLSEVSKAYTFVRDLFEVRAMTAPHNPIPDSSKKPVSFKYIVQPNDTIFKIAAKFKIDAAKIQKDNGIKNPDRIMVGQALMIYRGKAESHSENHSDKNAKAAPVLPPPRKPNTLAVKTATPERSKEGKGHPIAIIPVDQKRAPWMEYALAEAKRWAGKTEEEIGKTINYHQKTGQTWTTSMAGDTNAWCASFVNYCLMMTSYAMSKNKARAKSFSADLNFIKIDKPIYGAIAVFGRKGGGHVAFVYGKQVGTDKVIVVGGNQSDMITFVARSATTGLIGYYVPISYKQFSDKELEIALPEYRVDTLNRNFGIKASKSNREA